MDLRLCECQRATLLAALVASGLVVLGSLVKLPGCACTDRRTLLPHRHVHPNWRSARAARHTPKNPRSACLPSRSARGGGGLASRPRGDGGPTRPSLIRSLCRRCGRDRLPPTARHPPEHVHIAARLSPILVRAIVVAASRRPASPSDPPPSAATTPRPRAGIAPPFAALRRHSTRSTTHPRSALSVHRNPIERSCERASPFMPLDSRLHAALGRQLAAQRAVLNEGAERVGWAESVLEVAGVRRCGVPCTR